MPPQRRHRLPQRLRWPRASALRPGSVVALVRWICLAPTPQDGSEQLRRLGVPPFVVAILDLVPPSAATLRDGRARMRPRRNPHPRSVYIGRSRRQVALTVAAQPFGEFMRGAGYLPCCLNLSVTVAARRPLLAALRIPPLTLDFYGRTTCDCLVAEVGDVMGDARLPGKLSPLSVAG